MEIKYDFKNMPQIIGRLNILKRHNIKRNVLNQTKSDYGGNKLYTTFSFFTFFNLLRQSHFGKMHFGKYTLEKHILEKYTLENLHFGKKHILDKYTL